MAECKRADHVVRTLFLPRGGEYSSYYVMGKSVYILGMYDVKLRILFLYCI